MCSLCAIHFRLMVVSCRSRRAIATLLLSPLGSSGKSCSFRPRRRSSSRTMRRRCQSSLLTQIEVIIFHATGWKRRSNCPCAASALSISGSWSFLAAVGAPAPLCFYPLCAAPAILFLPAPPAEFLPHDAMGLLLPGLLALRPVMAGAHPLHRRRQQFLAEFLAAQTPAPPHRFIICAGLLRRRCSICRANSRRPAALSLGDPLLPQQPVHPQPSGPLARPA